jgi:hypothetical protein
MTVISTFRIHDVSLHAGKALADAGFQSLTEALTPTWGIRASENLPFVAQMNELRARCAPIINSAGIGGAACDLFIGVFAGETLRVPAEMWKELLAIVQTVIFDLYPPVDSDDDSRRKSSVVQVTREVSRSPTEATTQQILPLESSVVFECEAATPENAIRASLEWLAGQHHADKGRFSMGLTYASTTGQGSLVISSRLLHGLDLANCDFVLNMVSINDDGAVSPTSARGI